MNTRFRATQVVCIVVSLITVIGLVPTRANDSYLSLVYSQFKFLEEDEIGCSFCHSDPDGGEGWNSFGQLTKRTLEKTNGNMEQALYLSLKANRDSDNDGYKDALEIVARSLPGDVKSRPTQSIAQLERELLTLGGVEAFKPQ